MFVLDFPWLYLILLPGESKVLFFMLSSIKSDPDVLGDFCIVYLVVEALTPSSID